jgi:hypothetical protein
MMLRNSIVSVFLILFTAHFSLSQTTITRQVNASTDDAEESISDGGIDLTSSDLELIDDNGLHEDQIVGMRFNTINVPNGAYITNAFITFHCDEADAGPTNLIFRGQAADNAPTFGAAAFSISTRPTTAASAAWNNVPAWVVNNNYNTPSIANVIQEIIDRPGWVANNSLVILVSGTGERTAEARDGDAADAPILTITYEICTAIADPGFILGGTSERCQGAGSVLYGAVSAGSTSISYSLDALSLAAGNTINPATGQVNYVPGYVGTSYITATALGCRGPKTVVHEANTLPSTIAVSFPGTLLTNRCTQESSEVYAVNPIVGATVEYTIDATSLAGGVTINDSTGSVFYPTGWIGITTITATATSACGSGTQNFIVSTGEVQAVDDFGFGGLDESVTIILPANDICDIDPTTVSIVSGPSNGTLTINAGGEVIYTPNPGYSGADSYTYEICGLLSPTDCDQATVNLSISPFFADDYFNSPPSNCEYVPVPDVYAMAIQYEIPTPIALYSNPQIGDIDGDGVIEIVALSAVNIDINNPRRAQNIYIFNGSDGTLETTISTPFLSFDGATPFAIADLDDDGDGEIIVAAMDDMGGAYNNGFERRLVCYSHTGTQLWVSNAQYGVNHHNGTNQAGTPSIGIADFNQDGIPEVYVYNEIFNALTGVKLCDGGANGVGNQHDYRNQQPGITVAADLRPSAGLELAAGPTVYDVTITNTAGTAGNSMVANNFSNALVPGTLAQRDGFTAIADINLDGVGDVIVMSENDRVYAYNPVTMTLIAHRASAASSRQGALFIGDIDGDGSPNIGYCRENAIDMLSYNGTVNFQLKWTLAVVDGSARTNLTMFDFNQDGTQEMIYRDESTLRIFDGSGAAPVVLVSLPSFSDTAMEGPVVADVDNDGSAEILVTTEDSAADADRVGRIQVFRSNASPWAPARKVWNQYAYYNTHVNDDLTIPTVMPKHWEAFFSLPTTCPLTFQERPLNTFNVQSTYYSNEGCPEFPTPDASLSIVSATVDCNTNTATINYIIRNLADNVQIPAGVSVSFYQGNPLTGAATLLSTQTYSSVIDPLSTSSILTFTQAGFLPGSTIFAVVGDDGSQATPITLPVTSMTECNYSNNMISFNVNCFSALGVDWHYFEAMKDGRQAQLDWATSLEQNVDFFLVERSLDAINFEVIGAVEAIGNSFSINEYEFHDVAPNKGLNYYRIVSVDHNGNAGKSDWRALDFDQEGYLLFPNPATDMLKMYNPFTRSEVHVKDMYGRVVKQMSLNQGLNEWDVSALSAGVYFIEIRNMEGKVIDSLKFSKI